MGYQCNPINIEYKYQFIEHNGERVVSREAADPSMVLFNGRYYLFPSMMAGFLVSDDLVKWEFYPLEGVPIYDYAPDVRVIGNYLYFSASNSEHNCSFFRTQDPILEGFEEIEGAIPFWDPNLFADVDGKIYLYWGCSNRAPIYGVELNPEDMKPKTAPVELVFSNESLHGFERMGEDHDAPRTQDQIEEMVQNYVNRMPNDIQMTSEMRDTIRSYFDNTPYIEGPWMDKHDGRYYLQYACTGSEYNVYSDAVYVSDKPLGPFKPAKNNPYSYKPGGFMPGAGHGSTMEDKFGNLWHAATMRISINHQFERRVGVWPAGYDEEGELFCNQRYGDWPMRIRQERFNPWENPEWMLLSYRKSASASSHVRDKDASKVADENARTWWRAATNTTGEWIELDLGQECDVHAIQINFADDKIDFMLPDGAELQGSFPLRRHIDQRKHETKWLLEGSANGIDYFVIEDKTTAETNLPHDLIVRELGVKARYVKCTFTKLPHDQPPCVSGLRVFGIGPGEKPKQAAGVLTERVGELNLVIRWDEDDAVGHNVLWGYASDKMYHSYMVFGRNDINIGALISGQALYVRVDTFNESGTTEGAILQV